MYRPKINFGGISLRLDQAEGEYWACGTNDDPTEGIPLMLVDECDLTVGPAQVQVEQGLVRFVKNNQIRLLTIKLQQGELLLWKEQRRGQYGIYAHDIPTWQQVYEDYVAKKEA